MVLDFCFPLLDIVRIAAQNPRVHQALFGNGEKVVLILKRFMTPRASLKNRMLVVRVLSNMFSGKEGLDLAFSLKAELARDLRQLLTESDHTAEQRKGLEV